jgi:cyclopropane-fatty-acyl-phospholipid synthase
MKEIAQGILDVAGIKINGGNPYDIQVHNNDLYKRVLTQGSMGLGESYMDGNWDCDRLDEFFDKVLTTNLQDKVSSKKMIFSLLKSKFSNLQNKDKSLEVGKKHYDVGNELYKKMLDKGMTYTCGYWKNVNNLDDSQEAKFELICKKIGLKKGMRGLDIGCGWGSFAKYAAEKYDANIIGITISKEQLVLGKKLCNGLPVKLRFQDYRDVEEKFDRIVSIGMFEHVGPKNHRCYMEKVFNCLKENGIFLLHTIGGNKSVQRIDPWINKYIFPNGVIPSVKQIATASEGLFVLEDWHNFGVDYDKTLMAWYRNFNKGWSFIKNNYDERFKRMWDYYLLMCVGSFRARKNQLWEMVLSKNGVPSGYVAVR